MSHTSNGHTGMTFELSSNIYIYSFHVVLVDCIQKVVAYEGVHALWSGTVSSLMLVSNPAVQFMVYEALKRNLLPIIPIQVQSKHWVIEHKNVIKGPRKVGLFVLLGS